MEIRLPKTIKDAHPEKLAKWVFLASGTKDLNTLSDELDFRVQVVSIFSGESKEKLYNVSYRDINKAFAHMLELLTSYEQTEPKGEVIIDGQKYIFDKDFTHMESGRVIDLKLIEDVHSDPCEVLSILYVEEGMKYNQVNERNHVLNPSSKRKEVFKKEFDGEEFMKVWAFFLDKYRKQKDAIYILNIAAMKKKMEEAQES